MVRSGQRAAAGTAALVILAVLEVPARECLVAVAWIAVHLWADRLLR